MTKRICIRASAAVPFLSLVMWSGMVNVSIDSSNVAGSSLGVAIDFTTAETGPFNACFPTCVKIHNFSAPGSTMGLPLTTNGFTQGDLILINNPANFTELEKGSPFNEVIVVLSPVGSLITFRLEFTDSAPSNPANPPDQISVFLLDTTNFLPIFPTSDPLGTDALFVVDLDGTAGGNISAFSPTVLGTNGLLSVVIPSQGPGVIPEPSGLLLVGAGIGLMGTRLRRRR